MSMPYPPYNYPMGINPMMGRSYPTNPPVTLYIGNLDEAVHEEQLFAHFQKYGQIHSVKIVRDRLTIRSRGFGYVNFYNIKDAENARLLSQYEKIGRKPIRILHKGDPRQKPEANLFVKNIDTSATEKDLHNHFSKNGPVVSVKIAYDKAGKSLGYGYVQFEKPEDSDKAIEELQGSKLKEQEIGIEKFKPRGSREVTANNNLYVKHLPEGSKEDIEKLLNETFGTFGKVHSLLPICRDGKNWSAFICYEREEDAQNALETLNGKVTITGAEQPLFVNLHGARDKQQNQGTSSGQNETNLFIKNLKPEVTDEQIIGVLKVFGEIVSGTVKEKEHDGKKFGQAFINFRYPQDAANAQANASGKEEVKKLFYNDQPYIGFLLNKEQRSQFKLLQGNRIHQSANPYAYQKEMVQMQMYPQYQPNFYPPNYGMMQQRFPLQNPMQQPQIPQRQPWMGGGQNFQPQQQQVQHSQQQPQQQQPFGQQQQQYNQNFPRQQQGQQMNRSRQGPWGNQAGQRPQNRPYYQGGQQQREGDQRQGGYRQGDQRQGDYRQGDQRQGGDQRGGYQRRGAQGQYQNQRQQNETNPNSIQRTEKEQTPSKQTEGHGVQLTVQNLKDKLEEFVKLDQDRQRGILGEMLFPKVLGLAGPVNAPKITGMLVDFEVLTIQEILELLEDQDILKERVGEAQELIEQENS